MPKKKKNKSDRLEKLGISEIDEKHHKLVGKYKYRFKIPGNGNCQCASKAACLLGDPSAGPNLATQENGYIVEHWEGYFDNFFFFPQTLQLGGGKTLTVQNPEEFLQFLVLNPEMKEAMGACFTSPLGKIPGLQTMRSSLPQNQMGRRWRLKRCGSSTVMVTITTHS